MRPSTASPFKLISISLFLIAALALFGCSSHKTLPPAESRHEEAGEATAVEIRAEKLFGKYVLTDYAWCAAALPKRPEAWARERLTSDGAVLPRVFAFDGVVVLNPRYEIRQYPRLTEGEVPTGLRRTLSDFYGAGRERNIVTVLEVYKPKSSSPRQVIEVIDKDTLWDITAEGWLFEWRREGVGKNPIPLQERFRAGTSK
jgi:hypothetical protein